MYLGQLTFEKGNFIEDYVKKSVNSKFFPIMHSENKNILPVMDVTVSEVQSVPKQSTAM